MSNYYKCGEGRGKIYKSMKVAKVKYIKPCCGKLTTFHRLYSKSEYCLKLRVASAIRAKPG